MGEREGLSIDRVSQLYADFNYRISMEGEFVKPSLWKVINGSGLEQVPHDRFELRTRDFDFDPLVIFLRREDPYKAGRRVEVDIQGCKFSILPNLKRYSWRGITPQEMALFEEVNGALKSSSDDLGFYFDRDVLDRAKEVFGYR